MVHMYMYETICIKSHMYMYKITFLNLFILKDN